MNSPVNFKDPTGHMCSDPEDPTPICDGSGGYPPNIPQPDPPAPVVNSDPDPLDEGQEQDVPTPTSPTSTPPSGSADTRLPPCEYFYSHAACQSISNYIGIGVLTLDTVAGIGSSIFAILASIAILGGPFGIGTVESAYLIGNPIEGWMGGASFALTTLNDLFITGGSYISLTNKEVVISSDVIISGIFAGASAIDPEPFGDSLMNDTAAIHDFYRLTGGDVLFNLHLTPVGWYLSENNN